MLHISIIAKRRTPQIFGFAESFIFYFFNDILSQILTKLTKALPYIVSLML